MNKLKIIWWLIQINAVLSFSFIGVAVHLNAPIEIMWILFTLLFIAALLEYVAYHGIYKKHIKKQAH